MRPAGLEFRRRPFAKLLLTRAPVHVFTRWHTLPTGHSGELRPEQHAMAQRWQALSRMRRLISTNWHGVCVRRHAVADPRHLGVERFVHRSQDALRTRVVDEVARLVVIGGHIEQLVPRWMPG